MSLKNKKDIIGKTKVPMHLIPGPAQILTAQALGDGAEKYGPFNWRITGIEASQYLAACERHIKAWQDGEECADDSGVHHLAHAAATLLIMLDAQACGSLNDDRPRPGPTARLLAETVRHDKTSAI